MHVTRRGFLIGGALATSAVVFRRAWAASEPSTNIFEALRRGVGVFKGRGGTIGWRALKDGVLVVDSQFPDNAKACLEGVRTRAIREKVDALVNTHHHFDHTGGNGVFREAGVEIVAHENVPALQRKAAASRPEDGEPVVATKTFKDTLALAVGTETVRLSHWGPAHTGGDSVVHFESADVVHMGDLVFNRWYPFIDRDGGASIAGWIGVLERTAKTFTDDTLFIFGHGKAAAGVVGGRKDVLHMRDYLSALLEFARSQSAAGKSAQEIAGAAAIPGFEDHESASPRLSLAANLEAALAELAAR